MNTRLGSTAHLTKTLIAAARGQQAEHEGPTLRLSDTATGLERRAQLAHAQRLGVAVSPEGVVDLARSDALLSGPRGGAAAVRRAATREDAADRLSLAELQTLQRGRLAELFSPRGQAAVAHAQLEGAMRALESTADQLLALGDRAQRQDFASDDAPITAVRRLAARATKTADDLDGALHDRALGFATPAQLEGLAEAYARVRGALARLEQMFPAEHAPRAGLDRLLFELKEGYGSGYGAITPQLKLMEAGDALRAALGRVAAHAPTFERPGTSAA